MNLDSLKKSLAKIPAWVKANPKKAAVIGVVLAVVIYFAIKRGAQSSGSTLDSGGNETLDSAGGGLGASELTSGGGGSSGGGSSGESTTTTTTDSSGGFDGGGSSAFDSGSFAMGDYPSSFASLPPISGSSAAVIASPTLRGLSDTKKISTPPAPIPVTKITTSGAAAGPLTRVTAPAPVAAPKVANTLSNAKTATPVIKTDAAKKGLATYFTGVSGGRRYVMGADVGAAAPATPVKSTAGLRRA